MSIGSALKWGICSAGKISNEFVCALRNVGKMNHQICAVAARTKRDADNFAARHEIKQAYGNYEDLSKDPNICVVYVGAVNSVHASVCKLFLNAGKHVLCEKPLTMTKAEAEDIINIARERNLFLMEGYWTRFTPAFRYMESELNTGAIGEVNFMTAHIGKTWYKPQTLLTDSPTGGSTVMSMGCYAVMYADTVFGGEAPLRVVASGSLHSPDDEDTACITLHYSRGRMANIILSISHDHVPTVTMYGSRGCIEVPEMWRPTKVRTPHGDKEFPPPKHVIPLPFNKPANTLFAYEAQAVKQCIDSGLREHPDVSHASSLRIISVLEEARRQMGIVWGSMNGKGMSRLLLNVQAFIECPGFY